MRIPLRSGVTVEQAGATLDELANSVGSYYPQPNQQPVDLRDDYVRWSLNVDDKLRSIFESPEVLELTETPRHRDICSMPPGNQLTPLISHELSRRAADFTNHAKDLRDEAARMRRGTGTPLVVDTNALLHYQRPDSINWQTLVGGPARLIIPMRVIEEIDQKKYAANKRLAQRARDFLPWLDRVLQGSAGPTTIRDGATIEVELPARRRRRPMHADDEILDVAIDIKLFAGTVRLVTGDTGMRLAALNEGLEPLVLPRTYRRDLTDDPTPPADTTGGAEHASLETLSPIAYELRHDTEASDHAS